MTDIRAWGVYRFLRRFTLGPLEAWVGPIGLRRLQRGVVSSVPSPTQAIAAVRERWPDLPEDHSESPIFLLGSSWRSGSTLLQRLVSASQEALIWGEPYAHCDYVRRLAESLLPLPSEDVQPGFFIDSEATGQWHAEWIANLYPEPDALIDAHRQFFKALYAGPARRRGYSRWGIKEVRLGGEEVAYLRWLFPAARIVFLHRNPHDAYRSYRSMERWYDRWPQDRVLTPAHFGRLWRIKTASFVKRQAEFDACLLSYEELCTGERLAALSGHLGVAIGAAALERHIGGRTDVEPVPRLELRRLRSEVEPLAASLGYAPP